MNSGLTVKKSQIGIALKSIFQTKSIPEVIAWSIEASKYHLDSAPKELYKFSKKIGKYIDKLEIYR